MMTPQNYHSADQSAFVGVAGGNEANEYLRYKQELDRQRAEREAAKKKAAGGWWKRALVNGIGGAIQGGISGGIGGAVAGGVGGAGISALGDASGMNGASYGLGGANLGGAAGMAYRRWAANRGGPAMASSGQMGPPEAGQFDFSPGVAYDTDPSNFGNYGRGA